MLDWRIGQQHESIDLAGFAVDDRIRRYAKEGRQPLVRYGQPDCLLLAVAMGQNPVVILRSSREQFTELRSAALIEWVRVARRATPRPGQPPFTRYNT